MTSRLRPTLLLPAALLGLCLAAGAGAQDLERLGPEAIAIIRAELEELEFQRADLAGEIAALDAELAAAQGARDAVAAELAGLRGEVDAARAALDEAGDRQAVLARLEREIAERAAEHARAEEDLARARQLLDETQAAAASAAQDRDARLAEVDAAVAAAEARRTELEADVDEVGAQLADLLATRDAAAAELATLEAQARAAQPVAAAAGPVETQVETPLQTAAVVPDRRQGAPRPQAGVAAAVASAPGLEGAGGPALAALTVALSEGACVTDALGDSVARINRWTAAALVRALGDC